MEYFLLALPVLLVFSNGVQASESSNEKRHLVALWTTWGRWSSCSRSCDIGVQSRRRYCVARDGSSLVRMAREKCPDKEKETKICKLEPCQFDKPSPREAQCKEKNERLFGNRRYEWYPYSTSGNPCLLGCMAKYYGFFYSFGPVVDGTRCHNDTQDICVQGYCRKIGCDGMIGSNAQVDNCGVCGGRNRKCFHFKSVFSDALPKDGNFGYTLVAKIPVGATFITARDNGENYLALADANMEYIFNGNFKVTGSSKYNSSGSMIEYELEGNSEVIKIDGPTTGELNLMVIFLNKNPGISYEYWIPREKFANIHSLLRQGTQQHTATRHHTTRSQGTTNRDSRHGGNERPNGNKNSDSTGDERSQRNERHQNPATSSVFATTVAPSTSQPTARSVFSIGRDTVTQQRTRNHGNRRQHSHHHGHQQSNNHHHQQTHATGHHHNTQHTQRRRFRPYRRRRPNSAAFVSDQALCPSCERVELTKEGYCTSDFVIKGKVLWFDIIGERTRYIVKVLRTYHNKLPLMVREYIWTPNKCRCPHLQQYRDYILTGRLVTDAGGRVSRLMVSPTDFSSALGDNIEKEIIALKSKCT